MKEILVPFYRSATDSTQTQEHISFLSDMKCILIVENDEYCFIHILSLLHNKSDQFRSCSFRTM